MRRRVAAVLAGGAVALGFPAMGGAPAVARPDHGSPAAAVATAAFAHPWRAGLQSASASSTLSVNDATGDAQPSDGRADLTSARLDYAIDDPSPGQEPRIKLSAHVQTWTDPATDPGWNGETGVVWALDTSGDGDPDWAAVETKQVSAVLNNAGEIVCLGSSINSPLPGEAASNVYSMTIDAACVGGPAAVRFGALMLYDLDGDPNTGVSAIDAVPEDTLAGPVVPPGPVPPLRSQGYWVVAADSAFQNFGRAVTNKVGEHLNRPVVGAAPRKNMGSLWAVASDGGVFAYAGAGFFGSMGGRPLNKPIVGMAATPTEQGYWLVASDGGMFAFGDAEFFGSMGGQPLNKPIVGMAATPDGGGYWLVASDGGMFAFGDAEFFGSMGGKPLNQPVVGMASTISGLGYWLVARDGGIFAFGDATFHGSTGSIRLNQPIVGMAASRAGDGYRFVAADGGVFCFGDARFEGSAVGPSGFSAPAVAIATA